MRKDWKWLFSLALTFSVLMGAIIYPAHAAVDARDSKFPATIRMGMHDLRWSEWFTQNSIKKAPTVTVAVIDTGCRTTHEQFVGRISENSYNFADNSKNIYDPDGHGTSVSSIITDSTPPNVQLMILQINDRNNKTTDNAFRKALNYALKKKADIVSLSWGTTATSRRTGETWAPKDNSWDTPAQQLRDAGIPLIISAGNAGQDISNGYFDKDCYITISSIKEGNSLSSFSNRGSGVDFCAPGEDVEVATAAGDNTYGKASGTSFSTPYIAAAAAYVKIVHPEYKTVDEIYRTLKAYCVDLGDAGKDSQYGWGLPYMAHYFEDEALAAGHAINFADVKESDYFFNPVKWAVNLEITNGKTPSAFSPHDTCSTAQIITFLWRSKGKTEVNAKNPFTDVSNSSYYYQPALWAHQNKLVSGDHFNPDSPCTRSAAVKYMWTLAGSPSTSGTLPFTDISPNAGYYQAVVWALAQGITSGTSTTTFSPDVTCTRAQIVTFLYRAYYNDTPLSNQIIPLRGTDGYSYPSIQVYQGYDKLFDHNVATKWCCKFEEKAFVEWKMPKPITVVSYMLTTAEDTATYSGRNPKLWSLFGRNNEAEDWNHLGTVEQSETFFFPAENFASRWIGIPLSLQHSYQYYRLEINANNGDKSFQLSQIELFSDAY